MVDATSVSRRSKGAGRVLKNLLAALPRVDPGSRYVGLVTGEGAETVGESAPGAELVVVQPGRGLSWELRGLPREARRLGADLVFTVREIVGFGGPPTVMHLFEPPAYRLRALRFAGVSAAKPLVKDALLLAALRGSTRRAAAVTAGSRTTAAWLRGRYGIEPTVVYPGIDPVFFVEDEPAAAGQGGRYLLHPSSGDGRENSELVLRAFAAARLGDVVLRLVGTPERLRPGLLERARELDIAGRVEVLEWVSDEQLRALYRGALALVHPSRYEAFAGLPALEAMALGTPVVALAAPGVTEALAGIALLAEREDPALLAAELRRLCEDEGLRASLGARGREWARALTWEATARGFAEVFRELLG